MRVLLYCIFKNLGAPGAQNLKGVGGQPVTVLTHQPLSAAVSQMGPADLTVAIPQVLAFKRVVEVFHRQQTVIPMRFGCTLAETAQVEELLKARRGQYEKLLEELEGCVEMGVRLLVPQGGGASRSVRAGDAGRATARMAGPPSNGPGQAYLAARRESLAAQDREALQRINIISQVCESVSGLFVCQKQEFRVLAGRLLVSLYFLVPRPSVPLFRQTFRQHHAAELGKFLLSGPWPPYNFVLSSHWGESQ
jgi:hypothetical protein